MVRLEWFNRNTPLPSRGEGERVQVVGLLRCAGLGQVAAGQRPEVWEIGMIKAAIATV
jgi:hypothetical protein